MSVQLYNFKRGNLIVFTQDTMHNVKAIFMTDQVIALLGNNCAFPFTDAKYNT